LAWSLGAHALLLGLLLLLPRLRWGTPPPPFEVEIISPFLGTGAAKLGAPKPLVPGPPPVIPAPPAETPPPKVVPKAPAPPKDWVLPSPGAKVEKPAPPPPSPGGAEGGTGTASKTGGSGAGSDTGEVNGMGDGGTALSALPRLLNRDEVMAGLRRLYPESERRAGREGDVLVMIHIGADGTVGSVDVVRSAGPAFDSAAKKVGELMRFSPAKGLSGSPVPVRLPQPIQFRLTD
jgi:protein TonB